MSCVCIYWNTFVLCSFSCKTDDLIDKMTHYQHSPRYLPGSAVVWVKCQNVTKSKANRQKADKNIYFLNAENNKSEDMKTWKIWVAYGTHLHLVWLKFLPHHIAGSPNSHNIHRNNREKKKRGKKKKEIHCEQSSKDHSYINNRENNIQFSTLQQKAQKV